MTDINDSCDYEDNPKDYSWTEYDFITLNLNIRGLYSKLPELNNLIRLVETSGAPPTVITLSETWLTKNSPVFEILGYKIFQRDREHKKGGGVAVLVSSRLISREVNLESDPKVVESCVVEIKGAKKPIIVGSLYRPPNTNVGQFLKIYKSMVTKLQKSSSDIIIGLDHNLDFLKSDKHHPTNDFINIVLEMQQIPTITRSTRIASQSATLIDNIILSQ